MHSGGGLPQDAGRAYPQPASVYIPHSRKDSPLYFRQLQKGAWGGGTQKMNMKIRRGAHNAAGAAASCAAASHLSARMLHADTMGNTTVGLGLPQSSSPRPRRSFRRSRSPQPAILSLKRRDQPPLLALSLPLRLLSGFCRRWSRS